MVPSGWELKSLEKVSQIIDCKHRTPNYVKYGIPLVSPGTIKWGSIDLNSPTKRVTEAEYESLMDHCSIDLGDLVLSRNQSVGIASYIDTLEPFVLGQDTVLIKPNYTDSKFLFYSLQSIATQKIIFKLAGGSTFSRINLGDIRKLKGVYPPLPEQRKIAQILSTWDKAISATESLIANSQQQKKHLIQQLLTGKKRFAEFEEEWKEAKLSQVGNISSGGTPSTAIKEYWNGHLFWVTPTDITKLSSRFISNTHRKITSLGLKDSSAKALPKGSLLVCTRATIGSMAITEFEMTTNQGFKNIIPNSNFNVDFLYYLLALNQHTLITKASGSTFLELSKKDFENLCFRIPTLPEQQKIASVLTAADQEIDTLKQKLAHLKQEKKALMQQLLTGKRRVVI